MLNFFFFFFFFFWGGGGGGGGGWGACFEMTIITIILLLMQSGTDIINKIKTARHVFPNLIMGNEIAASRRRSTKGQHFFKKTSVKKIIVKDRCLKPVPILNKLKVA